VRATNLRRSHDAAEVERIRGFILKHNSISNIYHGANPPRDYVSKKPKEEEIGAVRWFWADADFDKKLDWSDPAAVQAAYDAKLAQLYGFEPRPTTIVFSGGGFQPTWRLEQPIPLTQCGESIKGWSEVVEDVKARAKNLEGHFAVDSTPNIDRVLRVPGTVNHPTQKTKREAGRQPVLARVVEFNDTRHDLKLFPKTNGAAGPAAAGPTFSKKTGGGSTNSTRPADDGDLYSYGTLGDVPTHHRKGLLEIVRGALSAVPNKEHQVWLEVCFGLGGFFGKGDKDAKQIYVDWSNAGYARKRGDRSPEEQWEKQPDVPPEKAIGVRRIFDNAFQHGHFCPLHNCLDEYSNADGDIVAGFVAKAALVKKYIPAQWGRLEDQFRTLKKHDAFTKAVKKYLREHKAEFPTQQCKAAEELVLELVEGAPLWRTEDGKAAITVTRRGRPETLLIGTEAFRLWMIGAYCEKYTVAPKREVQTAVIDTLKARALNSGTLTTLFVRVAKHGDKNYLDMCDDQGRVIVFDKDGWDVITHPPVVFIRHVGMLPLPYPRRDGDPKQLKARLGELLNVSDDGMSLIVSFELGSMVLLSSYPILNTTGPSGSAKSTCARVVVNTVDPNDSPLFSMPKTDVDYGIALSTRHVGGVDNLSKIKQDTSNAFCKAATGDTITKRKLHTDGDEYRINVCKPQIITSINNCAWASDLADRCLFVELESIEKGKRKTDAEVKKHFAELHPEILGMLLDVLVAGLKKVDDVKLDDDVRMQDFARLAVACEESYSTAGKFMAAYGEASKQAAADVLEGDVTMKAVLLISQQETADGKVTGYSWGGYCAELFDRIEEDNKRMYRRDLLLPGNPRALSAWARKQKPNVAKVGGYLGVKRDKGGAWVRICLPADIAGRLGVTEEVHKKVADERMEYKRIPGYNKATTAAPSTKGSG
jgi:hypothetical protein